MSCCCCGVERALVPGAATAGCVSESPEAAPRECRRTVVERVVQRRLDPRRVCFCWVYKVALFIGELRRLGERVVGQRRVSCWPW